MRRRLVWIQGGQAIFYRITIAVAPDGLNNFNTNGSGQGLVSITAAPFDYTDATELTTTYRGTMGLASPPEATGTTLQDDPGAIQFIAAARQRMTQEIVIPATALTGDTVAYSLQITQQGTANGNRHLAVITCFKEIVANGSTSTDFIFQDFVSVSTGEIGVSRSDSGTFTLA